METEIAALIEQRTYEYYGLRITEEALTIGEVAPDSRLWIDGDPEDETLDGASALSLGRTGGEFDLIRKTIKRTAIYFGDHVSLLGSSYALRGEDSGEIIMREAVVLGAWTITMADRRSY